MKLVKKSRKIAENGYFRIWWIINELNFHKFSLSSQMVLFWHISMPCCILGWCKVENFNFKQASLFFSENRSDLSLNAFLEQNIRYFGVVDGQTSFFMRKGLNFQKIEPNFYYEEAFSRYRYANIPYFLRFFNISRAISQPGVNQFFQNFGQKYRLIPSNIICRYKSIHARQRC